MQQDVVARTLAGAEERIRLEDTPDVCPRCHRSVHPKTVIVATLNERSLSQAVFRCTHQKCQELFIGTYLARGEHSGGGPVFDLRSVSPVTAKMSIFPESITAISPTFVRIMNQAVQAESMELEQLVGIGLRKALEFLIKDFAVSGNPTKETEIRNSLLGNCITQYVDDPNVKECSKRAAWLGNDETHYTRKWETKDVNDLKLLVKLTVNWIDNVILTKKYISDMGSGKA